MATKTAKKYTPEQREAARQARAAKVEQMHNELTAAVDALTETGQWQRWLDFLGSFHQYSLNNTLLIQIQCPHATQVAGFKAWQAKGRQVRKGEKSIRIFGKPFRIVSETDEATGEKTRRAVKCPPPVVSVFDISQTDPIEGVEQPTAPVAQLQGDDPAALYERISEWMTGQGWTVTREQIPGETNGFCTVDGTRRIVVDADLSDAHAAKTAIHEAAHAILHTDDEGKLTREPDQATGEPGQAPPPHRAGPTAHRREADGQPRGEARESRPQHKTAPATLALHVVHEVHLKHAERDKPPAQPKGEGAWLIAPAPCSTSSS